MKTLGAILLVLMISTAALADPQAAAVILGGNVQVTPTVPVGGFE